MSEPSSMVAPAAPAQALSWRQVLRVVRENPLQLWTEAAYEQEYEVQGFLGRKRFLLNAPDAIQQVLVREAGHFRRTAASIRLLRPFVGQGLLLSEGALWRRERRLIAPTLAPRALPPLMAEAARAIGAAETRLAAAAGGEVDLLAAMQDLSLEIAGRTMFSVATDAFAGEMRRLFIEASERLSRPDLLDLVLPIGVPSPRDLARFWFRRRWVRLIGRIIAAREQSAIKAGAGTDLYDLLRAALSAEGKAGARLLRDEVATMLIAGHETTALTLFWSALLLAAHPEVQARIAAEASPLDLGPEGAAASLEQLPYTRAVVSEALRLYPPAAAIVRQAITEQQVGDLVIPRGALVFVSPWVLHRHRRLWAAPTRFDPERFLPGAPPIGRFAYLPFGTGPRVCVGAQFALAEATLVLASLFRRFEVARTDSAPVVPVSLVTTQPNRAPPFRLRLRR
jgi:unspecific monooxygenase